MADKISTIILTVDLECRNCDKRIQKTLCKLQERENIHTIAFDEKKNTVTISGPFDPDKICKKLCCKAGKVIIGIEINPKADPKPEPGTKDPKPAPKPSEPVKVEQSVVVQVAQLPGTSCGCGCESGYGGYYRDSKCCKAGMVIKGIEIKDNKEKNDAKQTESAKPTEEKKEKKEAKKDKPKDVEQSVVVQVTQLGYQPPVWQPGTSCGCGCESGNRGYNRDSRCGGCRRGPSWAPVPHGVVYGAPAYKTCTFFCEEDPQSSCSVM